MQGMAQFVAVLGTILDFREPGAFGDAVAWLSRSRWRDRSFEWLRRWQLELKGGRFGYPRGSVSSSPELEAEAVAIAEAAGLGQAYRRRVTVPTICLTHDVDYLLPTRQMKIKRAIASRALRWQRGPSTFLPSLRGLLHFDKQVGKGPCSTVFVASVGAVHDVKSRVTQWLLDPVYRLEDSLFAEMLELLGSFHCEVGLHGSFLSLSRNLLATERLALARRVGKDVRVGRQHWLNLPGEAPFQQIAEAGIRIDSTSGWNGTVGFRGGMARPFPLLLSGGRGVLWEVPLVLMDGPLFDDLGLNSDAVVERGKKILVEVLRRSGTVSIGWHERAADPRYRWFDAYRRLVEWAEEQGFYFRAMSEAVEPFSHFNPLAEREHERTINV